MYKNYRFLKKWFWNTKIWWDYMQDLFVTNIIDWVIADLKVWNKLVFMDSIWNWYFGLENWIFTKILDIPTYIVDNHNYALYFWYKFWSLNQDKKYTLIHIDQHSDLQKPEISFDIFSSNKNINDDMIWWYVNEVCQVWNFILPAFDIWILENQIQIRTEFALKNFFKDFSKNTNNNKDNVDFILDIDIDFWDFRMSFDDIQKSYQKVREIIFWLKPKCITIATSPFFMDQNIAIRHIKNIFEKV